MQALPDIDHVETADIERQLFAECIHNPDLEIFYRQGCRDGATTDGFRSIRLDSDDIQPGSRECIGRNTVAGWNIQNIAGVRSMELDQGKNFGKFRAIGKAP